MTFFDVMMWAFLIIVSLYLVSLPIRFINWIVSIVTGAPDPELEREVRRIKYIEKRMDKAGYGSARHMSCQQAEFGAEYDAILQSGRQPIP